MSENDTTPAGGKEEQAMATDVTTSGDARVILRSWPKIVMMWPTLIMSIVCAVMMSMWPQPKPEDGFTFMHGVGLAFLIVLAVNLITLLYDLHVWGFFLVVLSILTLVLGLFLLDRWHDVWTNIGRALSIRVYANSAFYFLFSAVLVVNLIIAWVITRFHYWKVERNEIIIHQGFMHEQERHPTSQARFTLVVDDVVEYALLGAGKLVFKFGDDDSERELTTVPFVHRKAKKLDELLGRLAVTST